ncbi:hypothetical protein DH2020_044750 [Rehmannia glutinosa]|uniref:Uncharacterized protein n=1 Tax=Rehmannia glutinosa TaxID=99300 RepID=A0ABR0UG39_REHGL
MAQQLVVMDKEAWLEQPTTPLGWWEDGEILGGRDGQAGGTWLACRRDGKLAFLTNVREIPSPSQVKSRGELPIRFLKSRKSPKDFAEELVGEADQFNGFNLMVADLRSMTMVYITNRPKDDGLSVTQVSPGIHVLSNAKLDTPWPKAQRLRRSFEDVVVGKYLDAEISLEEITEILMDTSKDNESQLPGIYPPEFEYLLSAIFVEANTPLGRYGTRSTSAVVLRSSGVVTFYERNLEKDVWKEQTISFHIETERVAA